MDVKQAEKIEKELRNNTEILDVSFAQFNLKVLSIAYSTCLDDTGIIAWIELSSIVGSKLQLPKSNSSTSINVKINFYERDNLLCSTSRLLIANNFNRYNTIALNTSFHGLVSRATTARIFATL